MNAVHHYTRAGRSRWFLLALAAMIALAVPDGARAQNVVVTSATNATGSGTINIKGNIDNTGVANPVKLAGRVNLNGAAQSIGVATAGALNFDTLALNGAGTKSAAVDDSVSSDLDATVSGGILNIGAHKLTLQGSINNTGAGATPYVFNTAGSRVAYAASGTQGIYGTTYSNLVASATAGDTLLGAVTADTVTQSGGAITINKSLAVNAVGTFTTIADMTGTSTLSFAGAAANSITTLTANTNGTISNGSSGALTVGTLTSNSGTIKSTNGNLAFTNAAVNAGTISDTGTSATMTFAGLTNNTNGKVFTGGGATTINALTANAGVVREFGAGGITVTTTAANSDTIDAANGGTLALNGAVTNNSGGAITTGNAAVNYGASVANAGNLASSGGTLTFASAVNNTGGTLNLTGTGAAVLNANFTSAGTLTFGNTSTVTYQGTSAVVQPVSYGNLKVAGSSAMTASASFAVNDSLALTKNLAMGSGDTLTLTSNAGGNVTDTGSVTGIVKRTGTLSNAQFYAFNGKNVGLKLRNGGVENIFINMQPDTNPTPALSTSKYVKRSYAVGGNGLYSADSLTELSLAYSVAELQGGLSQAKIGGESYSTVTSSYTKVHNPYGSYTRTVDSTNHFVDLKNIATALNGVNEFALAGVAFQTVADNGNWDSTSTWDDGVPGAGDDAIVQNTGITLTSTQNIGTVTLADNATHNVSLSLSATGQLTATGLVDISIPTSTLSLASGSKLTIQTLGTSLHLNGKLVNNGLIDIK